MQVNFQIQGSWGMRINPTRNSASASSSSSEKHTEIMAGIHHCSCRLRCMPLQVAECTASCPIINHTAERTHHIRLSQCGLAHAIPCQTNSLMLWMLPGSPSPPAWG